MALCISHPLAIIYNSILFLPYFKWEEKSPPKGFLNGVEIWATVLKIKKEGEEKIKDRLRLKNKIKITLSKNYRNLQSHAWVGAQVASIGVSPTSESHSFVKLNWVLLVKRVPPRHRGFQWALPPGARAGDPLSPRVQHRHTVDSTSSAHVQFVSVTEPGWFSRLLPPPEPGCLSTPLGPAPTSDVTGLHINSPGGEGRPLDWASDGFCHGNPEDQIQAWNQRWNRHCWTWRCARRAQPKLEAVVGSAPQPWLGPRLPGLCDRTAS